MSIERKWATLCGRAREGVMNTVRWGLIGCGEIARKSVGPALAELSACELAAVASRDRNRAQEFARDFGARRTWERWEDLVADSEVDAVYIATPHYLHADQSVAAARSGKHVLCEKPLALNGGECLRVIEACSESGVKLGVAYYRRFYPVVGRLKELLASGVIGIASLCQINSFTWYNLRPGDPQYWLFERAKSGGGPLMIGGCHRIEVLLNLFGPIRATLSVLENVRAKREIEDTAVAVFQHKSGPVSVLCMSHSIQGSYDTLDIYGSEGSIHVPTLNRGELSLKIGAEIRSERHPCPGNPHLPLIESFCHSVRNDEDPVVNGQVGLEVQLIEDAIYGGLTAAPR